MVSFILFFSDACFIFCFKRVSRVVLCFFLMLLSRHVLYQRKGTNGPK